MKIVKQGFSLEEVIQNNIDRTADITVAEIRQLSSFSDLTEKNAVELIRVIKEFTGIVFNCVSDQKETIYILPMNTVVTNKKAA